LAKQVNAPVVHVNGDRPEDVVRATRLAVDYVRRFRKDIFVDMICYRRHGHNELDDPTFTNPLLYKKIHSTRTIADMYAEQLVSEGQWNTWLFDPVRLALLSAASL
jgi:probable 2-oxoglutarate dehydrogenase E1 component DHKTD1